MSVRYFICIKIFFLVLLTHNVQAKEYSVGKTFENLFHIDFISGKRTLPLPPGVWTLFHTKTWDSSQGTGIIRYELVRLTADKFSGQIRISTPMEVAHDSWKASGICEKTKWRKRSNLLDAHGEVADNSEECLALGWMRGWKRRHSVQKKKLDYLSSLDINTSDLPVGWMRMVFNFGESDNSLRYRVYLPPEHYNFEREEKYGYLESPWVPNNIDQHPKKKKFMESAISWAKSWKKLVKKGFVDNQLSLQEVLNHPKIDGSMAITAPAKKVSSPKVTAPAGDMVSKLKKLKKLYDAELISEEEYKEKKKAILEAM